MIKYSTECGSGILNIADLFAAARLSTSPMSGATPDVNDSNIPRSADTGKREASSRHGEGTEGTQCQSSLLGVLRWAGISLQDLASVVLPRSRLVVPHPIGFAFWVGLVQAGRW